MTRAGHFPITVYPTTFGGPLDDYIRNGYSLIEMDAQTVPPLSPAVLHILLALTAGDRHGYAIMKEAAEQSEGRVRLGPGTLYRSIQNLLSAGWIEEAGDRVDLAGSDERRRYYRLTNTGRDVVTHEARRLSDLVRLARRRRLLVRRRPDESQNGSALAHRDAFSQYRLEAESERQSGSVSDHPADARGRP